MTRIAALGVVAAVAGVALYELPASPFDHQDGPGRPVAHSSANPDDTTGKDSPDGTGAQAPGAQDPGAQAPGAQDPDAQDPADQNPSDQNPSDQDPSDQNPSDQNPSDQNPSDQNPSDQNPSHQASTKTSASTPTDGVVPVTYPIRGTVSYSVLPGDPATIGSSGQLMRFQIAIEGGIQGVDGPAFAKFVRKTYGAPQGWTAAGQWRFRQVGPGQNANFKLLLVTPETRDILCGGGPDRYTSCRIGDNVVLNVARWAHAVPNYGASLTAYRQYMVNHETGHRLGNHHELCPGPGQPAPVMEQQTLGLHGCVANSWPYLNGTRYKGRPGQYNDPAPTN
ncbi:DUF3152 domain-containing protein [Kribbella qitaiheensis]|uniref:DUF3152 domain-containing protein n=2 Tax=Kribbella qitaiheensis TaxID=1544730 RepID=A0A7G6X9W2_9ACTN|nr:DUF3152 domain-containing protein [Kribbella qitaiheensis]